MQKVKICGITNLEDALFACENGADALGFVFYKPSPRYIEPKKVKKIVQKLPPFVKTIGLFVNESAQIINDICHDTSLDTAQIHFEVTPSFLDSLSVASLPVIRAKSENDLNKFLKYYKIVDSYCESYGGSGKRLNLEWFKNKDCSKIILAGGLTGENVKQTKPYGFYGVDVSSGVEAANGKKDFMKVKDFIYNAKKC